MTTKKKKLKEKTEIQAEREYIIPLRRAWLKSPKYKRAPKAIKAIKQFIARHMKVEDRDLNKVKINKWLNQEIWFRGIKKPPAKIKVKAVKKEDNVFVELVDIPDKVKFAMAREKKKHEVTKKKKAEKKKKEEKQKTSDESKKKEESEKKEETKEKKESVKEVGKQMAKQAEKAIKHKAIVKQTQPKHQVRKALGK